MFKRQFVFPVSGMDEHSSRIKWRDLCQKISRSSKRPYTRIEYICALLLKHPDIHTPTKSPTKREAFLCWCFFIAESESFLSVLRILMSAFRNSCLLGFTKKFPLQTNSFKSKSFHPNRFCAHVHREQFRLANLP